MNLGNLVIAAAVIATLAAGPAIGQSSSQAKNIWNPPVTFYGQPDLQGAWFSGTDTPLERPADLAGKELFANDQEAEAWLKKKLARSKVSSAADPVGSYNDLFYEPGGTVRTRRTSMVVEPPDGRIPPLTPAAREVWAAKRKRMNSRPASAEDRTLRERCLTFPTAAPPMMPYIYSSNYQIIQSKDEVVIHIELNHDVRVIHLDGRPHLPPSVHLWFGDSLGHWEGNTLVVDTTNLTGNNEAWGADQNLHVVERFSRTAADTLLYQWEVDDPTAFTSPWKAEYTMASTNDRIFEYACHEGNYSLHDILSGARAEDAADHSAK